VPDILRMPEVAANVTEAILAAWTVAPGVRFAAGDPVVTVETDKAVVDVEAEAAGVLLLHLVDAGALVEVGSPIAVLSAVGEVVDDLDGFVASLGLGSGSPTAATVPGDPSVTGGAPVAGIPAAAAPDGHAGASERIFASPLARRLARDAEVDLAHITGTGPGGRVRRADVEAHLAAGPVVTAAPAAGPAPAAAYTDVPNSRMRNAIAARLTESVQTAPHFYLKGSARVDALLAMRAEINALGGAKVSVNDLVVKAVAKAHTLVPDVNVTWNGDSIRHYSEVDVAIAVATDNGLVTPVVRSVDRLSITEVAAATQDLAARAKDKRLQQSELEGGTISVSNLGMLGTEEFSAIINPPHAAILAVGAARQEPVVTDGVLAAATVMRVTLSVDHRPVDGTTAARWMQVLTGLLEHPAQILA
jgi:pyruvate dehydrogenase E2 component (dihydrolipoamide acetyltransferase)